MLLLLLLQQCHVSNFEYLNARTAEYLKECGHSEQKSGCEIICEHTLIPCAEHKTDEQQHSKH